MNEQQHPNDSAERDSTTAAAGNPYKANFEERGMPELDAGAPALSSPSNQRPNVRAMAFLGGMAVLLIAVAALVFSAVGKREPAKPRQNEETLTISEAPKPLALPHPETPRPAEPIPLAQSTPPLPTYPGGLQQLPQPPVRVEPTGPSLMERRMQANSELADESMYRYEAPSSPTAATAQGPQAKPLIHADTLLTRGTFIRCTLQTRIVTDIPGFTSCSVTEPVYSFTGRTLLLPKGSKVLGSYGGGPVGDRVAVIWDRIVTPTGIDVNMSSPGVDNLGGAGQPGHLDNHWGSRIGAAMLISMLSDGFKYAGAKYGPSTASMANGVVVQSPFESNTAETLQDLASQAVQQAANRPATVTIHQGTVLNVYVAKDVDFSGVVARY